MERDEAAALMGGMEGRTDEALVERLAVALRSGRVEPAQVERLLAERRRPWRAPAMLVVVGALAAFAGAALALALAYDGLPYILRVVLPFAFPLTALGAAVALHRRGGSAWAVEVAALTGYAALAVAEASVGFATGAGAGYATVAALLSAALVLAVARLTDALTAAGWGLSASLVAAATAAAIWADASTAHAPWLYLGEACVALLAAAGLASAGRGGVAAAARTSALLVYAACVVGAHAAGGGASPWHLLLSLAIVATLLAATRLDSPGLAWVGAAGGVLVWLPLVAVATDGSAALAAVVVAAGATLAALGLVGHRRGLQCRR